MGCAFFGPERLGGVGLEGRGLCLLDHLGEEEVPADEVGRGQRSAGIGMIILVHHPVARLIVPA